MLRFLPTPESSGFHSPGFLGGFRRVSILMGKRKLLVKMESETQRKFSLKNSSFHSVTDQDQRASCFTGVYQSIPLSDSG